VCQIWGASGQVNSRKRGTNQWDVDTSEKVRVRERERELEGVGDAGVMRDGLMWARMSSAWLGAGHGSHHHIGEERRSEGER
jgi:hypothetical protein